MSLLGTWMLELGARKHGGGRARRGHQKSIRHEANIVAYKKR
jgi:hypothetical protein